MLDHVSITVSDVQRAALFWEAIMCALGAPCVARRDDMIGYGLRNRPGDDGHVYISIRPTTAPTIVADNRHWRFRARDRAAVDAFHAVGLASGGMSDGAPSLRAYHPGYYPAFLLDPDGKRIEAVRHALEPGA